MLGFAPVQIDVGGKTQGAVDLLVCAPNNTFILLECTTGVLKAEGKLANLVARTERVRRLFRDNGHNSLVLPAMVSPLTIAELAADLSAAAEHGIAVISKERLDELTRRSEQPSDAVAILRQIEGFVPAKAAADSA
jgi:hypothetical protein